MPKIEVTYDGGYPVACMGTLTIMVGGVEIYTKDYCCHSTGSVWFDDDWQEHVCSGTLEWNEGEPENIPADLRDDVELEVMEVLSRVRVCCGGCV
jgi:hypothetical protein